MSRVRLSQKHSLHGKPSKGKGLHPERSFNTGIRKIIIKELSKVSTCRN